MWLKSSNISSSVGIFLSEYLIEAILLGSYLLPTPVGSASDIWSYVALPISDPNLARQRITFS